MVIEEKTLREFFVGMALLGITSCSKRNYGPSNNGFIHKATAEVAYELADCMIQVRKEKENASSFTEER